MTSYQLQNDVIPFCQGQWNENTQQFETINSTGIVNCCVNFCNKISNCNECTNNECYDKCKNALKSCKTNCFTKTKKTMDCIPKFGCGYIVNPNKECMLKKKEEILKCCNDQCDKLNCNEECNDMFNFVINNNNPSKENIFSFTNEKIKNYDYFYMIDIILFTILLIVFYKI